MRIQFGNIRRFSASFYDAICQTCEVPVEEGHPIAYVDYQTPNELGPLCEDCAYHFGTAPNIVG
jgi:hypothetical protein